MKLSKRGEYGMRAMIYLAACEEESKIVSIKEIADHENISVKFLEQILLTIKNAGLLHSKMGVGGGYYLAKSPHDITLGQVERILDGPLAPIRCVSQTAYEPCACSDEKSCGLRIVMLDVRNAIANILDKTTLADILKRIEKTKERKEE